MKLKEYFDTINIDEIERFISDKQEENLYLEFKTVSHPDYNDENRKFDKKNISKTLSGFANSNGGIVIWGINAKQNSDGQDVAKDKKPIKQLTKFINLLNRLEGQAVTPTVIGVEHEKIEVSEDYGFVKTFIPQSENSPHIANFADKLYYKRSGDSFYTCEHYDIVDMLYRKKSPKLKVIAKVLKKENHLQLSNMWFVLISIENDSNCIAKYPYIALNLSNGFRAYEYGLDGNRNIGLIKVKNNVLYQHNYIGGVDNVVYPRAIVDIDKFFIEIHKDAAPPELIIDFMVAAENSESQVGQLIISSSDFSLQS